MSAVNYSVLLAISLCSLTAARFDDKPAKAKNVFPNNGVDTVLFSADLPKGHCIVNLNGDLSAQYTGSASIDNPKAQVKPEAYVSLGSPNERPIFVLSKKVYKAVKRDEVEELTSVRATRDHVYADAYLDYRGKVVVVVVPKKGIPRAYRRRTTESYRDPQLRELDGLLTEFCEK
jgi:hypothetical protein